MGFKSIKCCSTAPIPMTDTDQVGPEMGIRTTVCDPHYAVEDTCTSMHDFFQHAEHMPVRSTGASKSNKRAHDRGERARHRTRAHVMRQRAQACATVPHRDADRGDMQMSCRGHDAPDFCGTDSAMHVRYGHRRCKAPAGTREGTCTQATAGCARCSSRRCSTPAAAIACLSMCRAICRRR